MWEEEPKNEMKAQAAKQSNVNECVHGNWIAAWLCLGIEVKQRAIRKQLAELRFLLL